MQANSDNGLKRNPTTVSQNNRQKEVVQGQIESIVKEHKSLDISDIPNHYQQKFGKKLDLQRFGSKKLRPFVASMAKVKLTQASSTSFLANWYGSNGPALDQPAKLKHPTNELATKYPNFTEIKRQVENIVQSNIKIDISMIPIIYFNKFGKKLDLNTKLLPFLELIPSIRLENSTGGSVFAVWIDNEGGGSVSRSTNSVQLAVDDTTIDIVTFNQAVSNKVSPSRTAVAPYFEKGDDQKGGDCTQLSSEDVAKSFFGPRKKDRNFNLFGRGLALSNWSGALEWEEGALLGHLMTSSSADFSGEVHGEDQVFINTHEPFCFVTVGVQGAGKSHTLSCVLESCLLPFTAGNVIKLKRPMTTLVLHYDQNTTSICESAGLLAPNPLLEEQLKYHGAQRPCVPKEKAVVMVSPTFFRQRKAFYGDYCTVKPLLFNWKSLTADHIKRIMRIKDGDNQLYVAAFMTLLRKYQRRATVPDFSSFIEEVRMVCSVKGQQGPLDQRISLLESVVAESEINSELKDESVELSTCCLSGYTLIITDLTDPLLSKEEANGLFQVLTEQFRALPVKGGKLLCFDEAHKFMDGVKSDGLSEAIVNVARLMRHDGMRLAVSTQSPKALAPELLELVSVAVLHHFHSQDWWTYLQQKLALHDAAWEHILSLMPGDALAFATRHNFTKEHVEGTHILPIEVRPRITTDLGRSRRNM